MCQMLGFLIKKTLTDVKGSIDLDIVIVNDFNISFSSLDRPWILKASRESSELNYTFIKWAEQVSVERSTLQKENTHS